MRQLVRLLGGISSRRRILGPGGTAAVDVAASRCLAGRHVSPTIRCTSARIRSTSSMASSSHAAQQKCQQQSQSSSSPPSSPRSPVSPTSSSSSSSSSSSVSSQEVAHFDSLASTWWDSNQNPLVGMNPIRVSFIVSTLQSAGVISPTGGGRPLQGLRALDVGCGGGLLSESLARLGAAVTAVDPSVQVANAAREHSRHDPLTECIDYRGGTSVEDLAEELACGDVSAESADCSGGSKSLDVVCVLEVVEHATDPRGLLDNACRLLKPGGILFVSTLNRTAKSYLLAISGAEHVMRMVPVGTHTWDKFLSPSEVGKMVASSSSGGGTSMEVLDVCGMVLAPPFINMKWKLDRNDTDVNWIGAYRKQG